VQRLDVSKAPSVVGLGRQLKRSVFERCRELDLVKSGAGDLSSRSGSFNPSNETDASIIDQLLKFEQQSVPVLESLSSFTQTTAVEPAPTSSGASVADATSTGGVSSPPLSLWQGRAIVIGAAAIYGTNFAAIKLLDQVIPLAASAAIRFTLAAAVVSAAVAWNESKKGKVPFDSETSEPWWLGGEVGAWYWLGYLCQAWGLHFVDASKVTFFSVLGVACQPVGGGYF
jgi:hypothetical protein